MKCLKVCESDSRTECVESFDHICENERFIISDFEMDMVTL